LEHGLELSLHCLASVGGGHLIIGDNGLEFQVVLHHESGGHQVVVVHELDEGLQSALSIDLLFAHALDNTAGRALNADHEGVSELLVLNET